MKLASLHNNNIILNFRYDKGIIEMIKTLSGRRWVSTKKSKHWQAPICLETIEKLLKWDFILDVDILKWRDKLTSTDYNDNINIPGLKGTLRPFQNIGISYIQAKGGCCLLADEMGVGKTVQAIGYLQWRKRIRPVLVACPASAKGVWSKHVKNWMTGANKVYVLEGKPKPETIALMLKADIVVVNHEININDTKKTIDPRTDKKKVVSIKNTGWEDHLNRVGFKMLIIDEIHYLKNNKALRTKAIRKLAKKISKVLGLSGTPFENRPVELFVPLNIINPGIFPDYFKFIREFCGAKHNGFGWNPTKATNKSKLHYILTSTIMLRRKKSEVLTELPPKNRIVIPIKIDHRKYEKAEDEFIEWLDENYDNPAASIVEMGKLKRAVVDAKLDSSIQWIWDYLETGNKLVVFCHHKDIVEKLEKRFAGMAVTISGKVPTKKRNDIEQRFQTDDSIRLFIGTKAACEAITLTAAPATCFIEFWWEWSKHNQAEDRVDRMGQEADSVTAYYLIAEGTIEEDIAILLDEKSEPANAILDGKETEETSMIMGLLKRYNKEEK